MSNKTFHNLAPHLLMLFAVGLAAGSFPIGAIVAGELPSSVLIFFRFLVAALLFAPLVFFTYGFHIPSKQKFLTYLWLGLPSVIFFWCMFESLKYTSVINTGAIYTLVPGITAIYAVFINGERLSVKRMLALSIGIAGAVWIVVRGDIEVLLNLNLNKGDLLFLVGCLFTALHNPLVRKIHSTEPMAVMTFWLLVTGTIWLGLLSATEMDQVEWKSVSVSVYPAVLYLAMFSTLITFFIRQKVLLIIGPTRVASYGLLAPLFVIILSIVLGIEEFDVAYLPGMLLVALSIFVIQKD